MSAISDFEKWMRQFLLDTPETEAAVGERIYNSAAPPNTPFPYLIYQIVPLADNFGQGRSSIQTRLLCDVQIYARIPLPATIDPAVEAVKNKIKDETRGIVSGASIISIRHERPISRLVRVAKGEPSIIARGSTYKVWASSASNEI